MKQETLKMISLIQENGYWSKSVHEFSNELIDTLGFAKYQNIINKARIGVGLINEIKI